MLTEYDYFERIFVLLPLEHAEDKEAGNESVKQFEKVNAEMLSDENCPDGVNFEAFVTYAKAHNDTIQRYGRYPYRNDVLGRKSTFEEIDYLKTAETYG